MDLLPRPLASTCPTIGTDRQDDPCVSAKEIVAVTKDLVLFFFGVGGIVYQQLTGNVNFIFLAIFVIAAGIPGATNLISLYRGSGTESPLLPPVPQPLESDSSNST